MALQNLRAAGCRCLLHTLTEGHSSSSFLLHGSAELEGSRMQMPACNLLACLLVLAMAMVVILFHASAAQAQPSPGYFPSTMVRSMAFSEGYNNLWGPQHQTVPGPEGAHTLDGPQLRQWVQVEAFVPERVLRRVDQGAARLHRRRQHRLLRE
uniref:Uncharacterized protein n=1 Tax=Arundo donax TaxID=35708 RepID=A0A0A9D9S1_ARUDO